jgi:hypothetical protein
MRPVSGDFLNTLRDSHLIDAQLDLYFPTAPAVPVVVPVLGGHVTLDRTAEVRRAGSITMPWTVGAASQLGVDIRTLPLGGYAVPKRGIMYEDGSRELVDLGRLRVESVTWSESDQQATIELADRMAQVRDESFQTPFVATGQRVANAAKAIVQAVFGAGITYTIKYDPPTILQDVTYADDRLSALMELARAANAETYFDAAGNWVFDITAGQEAFVKSGSITHGSAVISGLSPSTADLYVGMTVTGKGIPAGRKIAAINSSTQVTLDGPISLSVTLQCQGKTGWHAIHVADTAGLSPGMSMVAAGGIGLAPGTYLVAITQPGQNGVIEISQHLTATGHDNVYFTSPGAGPQVMFAGAATAYPVWQVDAGERGVLLDASESLDRTTTKNGVLVTGQANAESPAFNVLVTDSAPTSPTRWGGPFGKVLRVEKSSAVQTAGAAQALAKSLLNEGLGLARSLTLTSAPNPALEAGDTVRVLFDDGRNELHIIDVVEISLGTEAIRLATRTTAKPEDIGAGTFAPLAERRQVFTGADVWQELQPR